MQDGITQMGVERPELIRVVSNVGSNLTPDMAYAAEEGFKGQ